MQPICKIQTRKCNGTDPKNPCYNTQCGRSIFKDGLCTRHYQVEFRDDYAQLAFKEGTQNVNEVDKEYEERDYKAFIDDATKAMETIYGSTENMIKAYKMEINEQTKNLQILETKIQNLTAQKARKEQELEEKRKKLEKSRRDTTEAEKIRQQIAILSVECNALQQKLSSLLNEKSSIQAYLHTCMENHDNLEIKTNSIMEENLNTILNIKINRPQGKGKTPRSDKGERPSKKLAPSEVNVEMNPGSDNEKREEGEMSDD